MKAQSSLGAIILSCIILAMLIPIVDYSLDISRTSIRTTKSREAVNQIAAAVDDIYKIGGGKTTILVDFPTGIDSYLVENNAIKLTVNVNDVLGDAISATDGNVTGNLTTQKGPQRITIEMLDSGLVKIDVANDLEYDITPPYIQLISPPNDTIANTTVSYINGTSGVYLVYNVTDEQSGIFYCRLYLDGKSNYTDYSVIENIDQDFFVEISEQFSAGEHTWYVSCADDSKNQNINTSETWTFVLVSPFVNTSIMFVYYDKTQSDKPAYRIWNGTHYSDESTAIQLSKNDINAYALKTSPTRDEKILLTKMSNGDLYAQVWNGTGWDNLRSLGSSVNQQNPFDVAYEQNSGDAIVVYRSSQEPVFVIWNGTDWSPTETVINTVDVATPIRWIDLESKEDSDEIILVLSDTTKRIHAWVWSGNLWGNAIILENETEEYDYKTFDIAYEQSSGDAIIAWSNADSKSPLYITWGNKKWSTIKHMNNASSANIIWIRLESRPSSDNIMAVILDRGRDINAQEWDGNKWGGNTLIDETTEYTGDYSRTFDIAYETANRRAMIVYADNDRDDPAYTIWDGSVWSETQYANFVDGDQSWIELDSDPTSNIIFMMVMEHDYDDVSVQRWDSDSWENYAEFEIESDSSTWPNIALSYDVNYNELG
ncbi:hypothetical protein ACFLQN_03785 [Candidatus Aenigmatarchaeota archaeon]